MYILLQNLLRIAGSNSQGKLVAPSTKSLFPSLPTPSIWTRNSVLTLRLDQLSPSLLLPAIESTSSINITLDFYFLAISKRYFTVFSAQPTYLLMISLLLMLKNVLPSISEAQALARKVLPVPGGPYNKIPFHGFLDPVKIQGNRMGIITASFNASLALTSPATSSHLTSGFSVTMAWVNLLLKAYLSALPSLSARTFFGSLPSLFLIQSPIFLISWEKSLSVSLNAFWSLRFSSFRRSTNFRQQFLALSLALVIAQKLFSFTAWLNDSIYFSMRYLYTFQVSYMSMQCLPVYNFIIIFTFYQFNDILCYNVSPTSHFPALQQCRHLK